ncbi:carbohydrate-binding protein [Streptomyces sp. NEAU-W12]|uniref:carbohydrate-binding protein n=1 Tax=Streptomyces sp. NEAU-W12 TaxID=2994668 RepID=UPI00224B25CD|nr:carbohydrate-binding protein [Streptomyces sp. NEAU-W12]MCX2925726.1 carbohydrate-binding protein [Streptomyces sp. NEAU-W12]
MTPGNNGASTPEDDDPFGYLYADGQANGAQPPSGGYGYPNSVNRVRAVGTRQYGQQGPAAQAPQQGTYGQPNANYAAPETLPGGSSQLPGNRGGHGGGHGGGGRGGGGRGRGPNTKGLLIGAVAVLAAVVVGISLAMIGGDDEDDKSGNQADSTPTQSQPTGESSPSASGDEEEEAAELPTIDAKALRLGGEATLAQDVEGAQSDGGVYVANLNKPGSSVTWTVDGIPKDGAYTVFVRYSTTDDPQSMTLTVNGKEFGSKLNMDNFARAEDGDFSKGWTQTFAWPTLNKGTNTLSVSCADGDKCNVLLDQLSLKEGQVKK